MEDHPSFSPCAHTYRQSLALALLNSGCEYARKVIAKDQLNQGAILYNQGNYQKGPGVLQIRH
jgi:outer membrane protein assembly factor BamE (lipoprotein component of BamABCDE complex)